jgi:hypothetical protein
MPTYVYVLLLLTIDLYSHINYHQDLQCIAMKHFITNAYKTHTFANIVRNLMTSRSRLSLEMFLINVESDFLKKNLPKIY